MTAADKLQELSDIVQASQKSVPTEIALLLLVVGVIIFIWDLLERRRSSMQQQQGFTEDTELISVRGSSFLPSRDFYSPTLGLASKPDALIKDGPHIIPVDIRPMSKKVRDRHVVAMLVHLRLIEELEGSAPPYGVLIMGQNRRMVKLKNTPEKQRWLEALLAEMRSIMEGVPAVPAPAPFKCKHCDVRTVCSYSAYRPPAQSNDPAATEPASSDDSDGG